MGHGHRDILMITSVTQSRSGNVATVTAVSNLSAPIYYFWYRDGQFQDYTTSPTHAFGIDGTAIARIDVIDSNDPAFDGPANAPQSYPATRTITWVRSLDAGIGSYIIQQSINSGGYTTIATVPDEKGRWLYSFETLPLLDLTQYSFQIVAIDQNGIAGSTVTLPNELVVRKPDAPNFSATFDAGTTKVTFAAA